MFAGGFRRGAGRQAPSVTATLLSKDDGAYRYAYTTLCFFFCCFIAQPRFVVPN